MDNEVERSTGDGIRAAAAAALADVDALEVTGDDRTIILTALLQARLRGFDVSSPSVGQGWQASNGAHGAGESTDQQQAQDDNVLGKIAARLKVDRDSLELIYALEDGEPHVVVSPKKIASNKSSATRQLGQLVAAARQTAGLEEWTSAAIIRAVVSDYGRMDSSNFAASLQQMDNVALIRGKGQQREVKITKPGLENTGELIRSLVGSD